MLSPLCIQQGETTSFKKKKKKPIIYSDILLVSFPKDQFLLKKYTKQMTVHAERCHFTNVFKWDAIILMPSSRSLALHLPGLTFSPRSLSQVIHALKLLCSRSLNHSKSHVTSNEGLSLISSHYRAFLVGSWSQPGTLHDTVIYLPPSHKPQQALHVWLEPGKITI